MNKQQWDDANERRRTRLHVDIANRVDYCRIRAVQVENLVRRMGRTATVTLWRNPIQQFMPHLFPKGYFYRVEWQWWIFSKVRPCDRTGVAIRGEWPTVVLTSIMRKTWEPEMVESKGPN